MSGEADRNHRPTRSVLSREAGAGITAQGEAKRNPGYAAPPFPPGALKGRQKRPRTHSHGDLTDHHPPGIAHPFRMLSEMTK